MTEKILSKKIIISAVILCGGLLVASGILALANFTEAKLSVALQSPQWTQEIGTGIAAPACASAVPNMTCSGGQPLVTFEWGNWYTGPADALYINYPDAIFSGHPTNGSLTIPQGILANNTSYTYRNQDNGIVYNDNWPFTTPNCVLTPIVSWLGSKGCVLAADGSGCDINATWKVSNVPPEMMVDLQIVNPIPPGGTTTYSNLPADPTQLSRVFTAGSYALTLFDHASPYAKLGETLALTVCPTGYTIDPTTGFCIAPPIPSDFTLSLGGSVACNSVPLSWTASNGATAYRILRGNPRVDISPYQPYTALNFNDTAVSQNTNYQYQIEAYNVAGVKRSNALNATTSHCPPTISFTANLISMFPKSSFALIDKLKSLISAEALGGTTLMNIFQGQRVSLNWTTTYVTSCTASSQPIQSNWSGSKSINGNQEVAPPPPQVSYTLQCSGLGGTASETIIINVTPLTLPEWREIIPR